MDHKTHDMTYLSFLSWNFSAKILWTRQSATFDCDDELDSLASSDEEDDESSLDEDEIKERNLEKFNRQAKKIFFLSRSERKTLKIILEKLKKAWLDVFDQILSPKIFAQKLMDLRTRMKLNIRRLLHRC